MNEAIMCSHGVDLEVFRVVECDACSQVDLFPTFLENLLSPSSGCCKLYIFLLLI